MHSHILLMDLQPGLSRSLESVLAQQGYRISQVLSTGEDASPVSLIQPDLVLMPARAAEEHHLHPCRDLVSALGETPIMLLGEGTAQDRVASLNLCASDYVSIPFAMAELLARIRAKLRRVRWERVDEVYTVGPLRLDARAREVNCGDRGIALTAKEFDLLKYLMAYPRQVLTQPQILDEVWSDARLTHRSNIVQVYVRSLRRKLGPDAQLIQTVRGVGYTLRNPPRAALPKAA